MFGLMKQATRMTACGRVLPFDGWECGLPGTSDRSGDLARAAAGLVNVEGDQELDLPRALDGRKSESTRKQGDALAAEMPEKAQRHVEA